MPSLLPLMRRQLGSTRTTVFHGITSITATTMETTTTRAMMVRGRNFSASSNRRRTNRNPKKNQWMHTGYDRRRHSDVNRSTGRFFFFVTTMASAISIFVMGDFKSEIKRFEGTATTTSSSQNED
mmetsp:Transcript_1007/g.2328  ORF Transcript_1007/g.2328 Transcript_1007/m.2328 type:complete len:125 (+) Transcript_1007:230-604(+)